MKRISVIEGRGHLHNYSGKTSTREKIKSSIPESIYETLIEKALMVIADT